MKITDKDIRRWQRDPKLRKWKLENALLQIEDAAFLVGQLYDESRPHSVVGRALQALRWAESDVRYLFNRVKRKSEEGEK